MKGTADNLCRYMLEKGYIVKTGEDSYRPSEQEPPATEDAEVRGFWCLLTADRRLRGLGEDAP